jgi:hypothetical protein
MPGGWSKRKGGVGRENLAGTHRAKVTGVGALPASVVEPMSSFAPKSAC